MIKHRFAILASVFVGLNICLFLILRGKESRSEPNTSHLRVEEVDHYDGCGILEYRPVPEEKYYMLDCSDLIIRNANHEALERLRLMMKQERKDPTETENGR